MIIKPLTRVYSLRTLKALQRTAYARLEISELKVLYNQLNKLNKPIMNTFFIARIGCSSLKIKKIKTEQKQLLAFTYHSWFNMNPAFRCIVKKETGKRCPWTVQMNPSIVNVSFYPHHVTHF